MYLPKADIANILQAVDTLQVSDGEVVMLLFAEKNNPDILHLVDALNQRGIRFFGGLFPGLIYSSEQKDEGCILKKFETALPPFSVRNIASTECIGFPELPSVKDLEHCTSIILVDGLTPNIYRFLEKLNDLLGEQCSFIGGGAGSISLQQAPCVFCAEGFMEDAAIVCTVRAKARLGVRHGWKQLAGPLVATQTEGNTIHQLNWEKAFDVYKRIVDQATGLDINADNFLSIAQGYPFGIVRDKADDIVRDPLAVGENASIICIGEVPANTVLYILEGKTDSLLHAADKAIRDCVVGQQYPIPAQGTFVVDCITRTLFLQNHFSEEMAIVRSHLDIRHPENEPFGILSLGEISSYGEGALELFNKTIVVGTFFAPQS